MKKNPVIFILLLYMVFVVLSVTTTQAKELPADGNIPLTSEYFPDEWFLKTKAEPYDRNEDGYLSPQEIAGVKKLICWDDLSDFSQVQYFTSLRELVLERRDDYDIYGIWAGNILDLTVFPHLESAVIGVDSGKAPSGGSSEIEIRASGLPELKSLTVYGQFSGKENHYDGKNACIKAMDLRNLPKLEILHLSGVVRAVLDGENRIKDLFMSNMQEIPLGQMVLSDHLERLHIWSNLPGLAHMDLSGSRSLTNFMLTSDSVEDLLLTETVTTLDVESASLRKIDFSKSGKLKELNLKCPKLDGITVAGAEALETAKIEGEGLSEIDLSRNRNLKELYLKCPGLGAVTTTGADALEKVEMKGGLLSEMNVSQNKNLKELLLECPSLNILTLAGADALEYVSVKSSAMPEIDISANMNLKRLYLTCPALERLSLAGADALEWVRIDESALKTVDISKNQSLKHFSLTSPILCKMDVSKNSGLEYLAVDSDQLKSIDVTKNKELKNLYISSSGMKAIYLKKNRKLEYLGVNCENMHALDLSANTNLTWLRIDATPLKKLDLKKQKKLKEFQMKNNQKPPVLDLSANVNLKDVVIENTGYREISLPKQKKLRRLYLTGNKKLAKVDLKNNRSLDWLIINGNKKLKKLDLSNNIKLDEIDVKDNALKTLKLGKQKNVRFLYCQGNKLKVLDLTDVGSALEELWCDKGMKVKGYTGKIIYL